MEARKNIWCILQWRLIHEQKELKTNALFTYELFDIKTKTEIIFKFMLQNM